jgi:iron complex transport system substrate-binding protein
MFLVLAVALTACSPGSTVGTPSPGESPASPTAVYPLTLVDDDAVEVTLPSAPQRIVTFAPSNTEIVFALGLGDRVVGVSGAFDDYPAEATTVQQVGGAGEFGVDPNLETVVSLEPDLFLAVAGGEEWKRRLRDLNVPVFTVNAEDFDDLLGDIRTVGRLTGAEDRAEGLTRSMAEDAQRAAATDRAKVSCFFEAYYPPLTTVGPRTFVFDLLRRAGCDPVSEEASSDYPEWSVDQLVEDGPDVYLVSSESGVSPSEVSARPGFEAIRAVREGRVHLIDSDLVARPGPRVVQGLAEIAAVLEP